MSSKNTRFYIGVLTKQLVDYLKCIPVGTKITYNDISTIIGYDVQRAHRHVLTSARKILEREYSIVFGTIIKYGLKRLEDIEIVHTGNEGIRKIRKTSRRYARRVVCIDYDTLPQDSKREHNIVLSILGTMHHMTSTKQRKKIENIVEVNTTILDHTKLLEVCK